MIRVTTLGVFIICSRIKNVDDNEIKCFCSLEQLYNFHDEKYCIYFRFLFDEGPTYARNVRRYYPYREYFDLYLYSAYAAHYTYFKRRSSHLPNIIQIRFDVGMVLERRQFKNQLS